MSSTTNRQSINLCKPMDGDKLTIPTMYIFNACSLAKPHALQQLEAELASYEIEAALINETHFKQNHTTAVIQIAGYNILRRDRLNRRAGGVAIVLQKDWDYEVLDIAGDDRTFELLWVRVKRGNCKWILGAVYHPPKPIFSTNLFLDHLERSTDYFLSKYPEYRIAMGGDFNQLLASEISDRTGLVPLNQEEVTTY